MLAQVHHYQDPVIVIKMYLLMKKQVITKTSINCHVYHHPFYIMWAGDAVPCQGLWDRCYSPLYNDTTTGTTTAKKLWEDYRQNACSESLKPIEEANICIQCTCCESYSKWKKSHSVEADKLQRIANAPFYYAVTDEHIVVKSNNDTMM